MDRLRGLLRIHPGEGALAARLLALMFVLLMGLTIGGVAVESLLLSRFGASILPRLYLAIGAVTFLVMAGMTALLRRARGVLASLHLGMAVAVALAWLVLLADAPWFPPVLWLAMMALWTVSLFAAWGVAGAVHDTRQAKRLFPLYGAGLIVGGVVGGLLTTPLARWLGTPQLLLVWAGLQASAFFFSRSVLISAGAPAPRTRRGPGGLRVVAAGFRAVRSSSLLRWMAVALGLFALLYFALTFVFARAATARYPDPAALAGFFGLFTGLSSGLALLVSLLAANRLFQRFGIIPMVLVLPAIYLAGFGALIATMAFPLVVGFRFVQMVWVNGVWATGWQALFNVVPSDVRAEVRTFMDGVPLQAGVIGAGGLLLMTETLLEPAQVAAVGLGASALAALAVWRARRAYTRALAAALRVGNPEVFGAGERPFGGWVRDRTARDALRAAADDPDPVTRRIAVALLAELAPADVPVAALADPDPDVRTTALRAAGRSRDPAAAPAVRGLLGHRDPAVRAAAVDTVAVLEPGRAEGLLTPLLGDADPLVRARAAVAVGAGEGEVPPELLALARSPDAVERAAGVAAAGDLRGEDGPALLVEALGDEEPAVRRAAHEALVARGPGTVEALVVALDDPARDDAALEALRAIGVAGHPALTAYAERQLRLALRYGRLWRAVGDDADTVLVADALRDACFRHGLRAVLARDGGRDPSLALAVENIMSPDAEQRANAMETLEASGERAVVRPLVAIWDGGGRPALDREAALRAVVEEEDGWLRAVARHALGEDGEDTGRTEEGDEMETLPTLPVVERALFLRRVSLFAALSPLDLASIAEIASEHVFPDGTRIAEQGERGDELYVIVSGEVRVLRRSDDGDDEVEVARRGPGQYVGEMSVITAGPRMASLVCDGEVRMLTVDRRRFERILRERSEAGLAVMRTLCERLEQSYQTPV